MITSLQNEKVKHWVSLKDKKYRDLANEYLIEGEHLVQEAYKNGYLKAILYVESLEDNYINVEKIEVSDEEANMRGYSMVMINLDGKYNESYQYVEYTDAEVAVLKETANHMADLLTTKSFEDAAKEAGLEVSTGAYEKDDATIEKDVLVAMDALKEGEVSKMIETESAIYFVRIDKDTDEEATEANRNSIIAERETALFELVVTDWQKEDGWKVNQSVVDSIEFHNMFTQNEQSTAETTEGE